LLEINDADWEFAHRLLQCVAVSSRPFCVEELAEFLAFEFKEGSIPEFHEDWRLEDPVDAVLSTCSSFLAIVDVDGSRTIQFSHFSVKEFLTSSRLAEASDSMSRRFHFSMPRAHTLMARACLGFLLHLDETVTEEDLKRYPLAEYAAEHWVDHFRLENGSRDTEDGMKRLFDSRKPHFGIWLWIHDPEPHFRNQPMRAEKPLPPRGTPLHYVALLGLHAIVEFLVTERPQDMHTKGFNDMSTPLHRASSEGHVDVARVLLEHGAVATARDVGGRTPLHEASKQGYVKLARVLLEHGAVATAQDGRVGHHCIVRHNGEIHRTGAGPSRAWRGGDSPGRAGLDTAALGVTTGRRRTGAGPSRAWCGGNSPGRAGSDTTALGVTTGKRRTGAGPSRAWCGSNSAGLGGSHTTGSRVTTGRFRTGAGPSRAWRSSSSMFRFRNLLYQM
jgi:hypothetical protein